MASATGPWWRRTPVAAFVLAASLAGLGVGSGGCLSPEASTDQRPSPSSGVASLEWTPVALPAGHAPVTLTAYLGGVLVGTHVGDAPGVPGLLALRGASAASLPVAPASPYGKEATWLSIEATHDGALVAVGGARGGAHSNVRWSVWRGDSGGLHEQEQVFSTFGGWGAGEQLGVIPTDAGPMLLGSWESKGAGLDADIWLPTGAEWIRQDPQGTPLASTATILVGPRGGAQRGRGAVVVGSVVDLRDGVTQRPAAWISREGNTGWASVEVPGASGEALGVGCSSRDECLVIGVLSGRLAAWRLGDGTAVAVAGLPDVSIPETASMPPPRALGESWLVVVPSGHGSRAMIVGAGSPVVGEVTPPPGTVTATIVLGDTAYAVTTDVSGRTALWSAAVTLQR